MSAGKQRLISTAIGLVAGSIGKIANKMVMAKVVAGWSKGGSAAKRAAAAERRVAKLKSKIARMGIALRRAAKAKGSRAMPDYKRAKRAVSIFGDSISFALSSAANRMRAV